MQTTFCSRRARQVACLAAISCALLLAGRYLWADQTEPRTVEEKTYSATPSFGPGGRIAANSIESLNQVSAVVPDDVAAASFATDDRELVINAGLLQVFDYFLRQASGANRENSSHALRMFLQERLTTASVTNALQIADNYRSYMMQHDGLLAAQNLRPSRSELVDGGCGAHQDLMQLRLLLRQKRTRRHGDIGMVRQRRRAIESCA